VMPLFWEPLGAHVAGNRITDAAFGQLLLQQPLPRYKTETQTETKIKTQRKC